MCVCQLFFKKKDDERRERLTEDIGEEDGQKDKEEGVESFKGGEGLRKSKGRLTDSPTQRPNNTNNTKRKMKATERPFCF